MLTASFYSEAPAYANALLYVYGHAHAHCTKADTHTRAHHVQRHTHTHTHALCDRTNKVGISASVARIPVLLAPE